MKCSTKGCKWTSEYHPLQRPREMCRFCSCKWWVAEFKPTQAREKCRRHLKEMRRIYGPPKKYKKE